MQGAHHSGGNTQKKIQHGSLTSFPCWNAHCLPGRASPQRAQAPKEGAGAKWRNRLCFCFVDIQKPLLKDEHHFKYPENVAIGPFSSRFQHFFLKKDVGGVLL